MPLDITLAIPCLEIRGDILESEGLGGSETMGIQMALALARAGQRIKVFGNVSERHEYRDVMFIPMAEYFEYVAHTPHDVCIAQRLPVLLRSPVSARLNILWCHDAPTQSRFAEFGEVLWNTDRIMLLSEFMIERYRQTYRLDPGMIWKTRNGVDLQIVPELRPATRRNMKRIVCAARPERGHDNFVGIMQRLLAADPEITLALCAYKTPLNHFHRFYDDLVHAFQPFRDRITWLGHLSKRDLYELFSQSALYVYPTASAVDPEIFEMFCICFAEAQACGLPIVSTDRGALAEVMHPDAGMLLKGDAWTPAYQDRFAAIVLRYLQDMESWTAASRAAYNHAFAAFSLDTLAKEWIARFEQTLADQGPGIPLRVPPASLAPENVPAVENY